jgi:hypothetical protein
VSVQFEHDGHGGGIVLRCDTYGEFIQFVVAGRILLNSRDFPMEAWEHIAERGYPPAV